MSKNIIALILLMVFIVLVLASCYESSAKEADSVKDIQVLSRNYLLAYDTLGTVNESWLLHTYNDYKCISFKEVKNWDGSYTVIFVFNK